MILRKVLQIITISALALSLPPAAGAAQPQRILSGKLIVEGSGDSQKILRAIARRFEALHPGTDIEIPDGIGNRGGIKSVLGNKVQLARVSRPLNDAEKPHGLNYRVFAKSPVVFATHPGGRLTDLSAEQIAGIYSGKFVNWKQLGGAASRIYPVGRESTDSGRTAINEHLPGFGDITSPVNKTYYTASGIVEDIARHEGAIGYATMAMVKKTGLKVLRVDGVYPLTMNVRNGTYKMVIPFAMVYRGKISNLALAFLDFLYSRDAQKIIVQYGCVPVDKGG
jgi:phosphate transport system substrate-binding protein